MKNIPQKIYLNVGDFDTDSTEEINFDNLVGISWCDVKINKNDIEFVLNNSFNTNKIKKKFKKRKKHYIIGFDPYTEKKQQSHRESVYQHVEYNKQKIY